MRPIASRLCSLAFPLLAASLPAAAFAQAPPPDPKFAYAKPADPPKKKVEWKASVQAGLIYNSGAANMLTVSGGGGFSRFDGRHKFAFDANGVYAVAWLPRALDATIPNDAIRNWSELTAQDKVSAENWLLKARYDIFFTTNNAAYLTAFVGGNVPGGKEVFTGAQIGYLRQLYKSARHELGLEAGYDFTFESFVKPVDTYLNVHSLRAFLGYQLTINQNVGLQTSIEGLFNLNPEDTNTPWANGATLVHVQPFEDSRVNFRVAVTSTLAKAISLRVGFNARFDNVPSPRSVLHKEGIVADYLDTLTEVALIVNFL